jgi:hypothetical protein
VAFVAADAEKGLLDIGAAATNATLRPMLDSGLTWGGMGVLDVILGLLGQSFGGFSIPDYSNSTFFGIPFGPLAAESVIQSDGDFTFQFIDEDEIPSNIVPLLNLASKKTPLIFGDPTYSPMDHMLMGVDPAKRVVYIGESDLANMTDAPIQNLWGNVWAWAIDQVLMEP